MRKPHNVRYAKTSAHIFSHADASYSIAMIGQITHLGSVLSYRVSTASILPQFIVSKVRIILSLLMAQEGPIPRSTTDRYPSFHETVFQSANARQSLIALDRYPPEMSTTILQILKIRDRSCHLQTGTPSDVIPYPWT